MEKSMKFRLIGGAILATLLSTAASAQETPNDNNKVIASVNGEEVTMGAYRAYVNMRYPQLEGKFHPRAVEEMVNRKLILQDAYKQKLDQRDEVSAAMKFQAEGILASIAVNEQLKASPITEERLRKLYDQQVGKGGEEYKAQHILVETENDAKMVLAKLQGGEEFGALAKAHSKDGSAAQGGDLGWFVPETMVPPFAAAVKALKKGETSAEPVKTQFGWHVIKLEDTRTATPPAFENVRDKLEEAMQGQLLQAYVQQLRADGKVEIKAPDAQ
jgi:peptidyl-prolyl cis-trans isomerase C